VSQVSQDHPAPLLDDLRRRFAPSYGAGLTNHLPMVCVALARLGADAATQRTVVDAIAAKHGQAYEPARPWPAAALLAHELRARGVDAVLRERLPRALLGLGGAAFHGAIRVAYATMSSDGDEIAHALAYLEESALTLDVGADSGQTGMTNDLDELVNALRAARIDKPSGEHAGISASITTRITQVAADARFIAIASRLVVDKSTLRQVSGLGARWYLAADDFASLHVLTGAHAVRVLRPFTDAREADQRAIERALAIAALACFVVSGSPARADARNRDKAEDRELKHAALTNTHDDHMAKLVVAALDEEAAHEDAIYRIVATRAARRGHT
jgi:hypothetical protein